MRVYACEREIERRSELSAIESKMSPLSNVNNTNNGGNNNSNGVSSLSSVNTNNNSSNSAFKPLINDNRHMNMLSSSASSSVTSSALSTVADHFSNDLSAPYGGAYHHHHHHHHLNSQLSTQDYLSAHHQTLPLGVYKSEHDDLQTYSFARPVKLYEHGTSATGMVDGICAVASTATSSSSSSSSTSALVSGSGATTNGYATNTHQNGFRGDAPSPGASIIDLSTSSVTSLRSGATAAGFVNGSYYDGQRYDRSPQSASSPHYSSPQMLSPQGQTLDLSVGRTKWVWQTEFRRRSFSKTIGANGEKKLYWSWFVPFLCIRAIHKCTFNLTRPIVLCKTILYDFHVKRDSIH